MLRNRKRMWGKGGKEPTFDEFVNSVQEMHKGIKEQKQENNMNKEDIGNPSLKILNKCDMGNSPEVQPRELQKL
jgi:hypothetical protein